MGEVGDTFKVSVGGIEYDTIIDDHGTQRFVETPDHFLVKKLEKYGDGTYDLNDMARKYHEGEWFNQRDYAEMNIGIGYSVCGFMDLSSFNDMRVINPLWEDDISSPFAGMDDGYLYASLENQTMTLEAVFSVMMARDDKTLTEVHADFVENVIG